MIAWQQCDGEAGNNKILFSIQLALVFGGENRYHLRARNIIREQNGKKKSVVANVMHDGK